MTEPAKDLTVDHPARDGALAAADALAAQPEPRTAVEAAARIRVWRDLLRQVGAVAEAQVMAACWAIRREHPDRGAFDVFIASHLADVFAPDRAWLMAGTWDVARSSRPLRELTLTAPADAMAFVRDFVAAVPDGVDSLDEIDREVVALEAAPPRARQRKLRELVAARGEGGREAAGPPSPASPVAVWRELVGELAERKRQVERLADRIEKAPPPPEAAWWRARVHQLTDGATGELDRIAAAVQEASE